MLFTPSQFESYTKPVLKAALSANYIILFTLSLSRFSAHREPQGINKKKTPEILSNPLWFS